MNIYEAKSIWASVEYGTGDEKTHDFVKHEDHLKEVEKLRALSCSAPATVWDATIYINGKDVPMREALEQNDWEKIADEGTYCAQTVLDMVNTLQSLLHPNVQDETRGN